MLSSVSRVCGFAGWVEGYWCAWPTEQLATDTLVGVSRHLWLAPHLPVLPPCDLSEVSPDGCFCDDPLCYRQVWNALAIPTTLLYVAVMDPRYVILYSPDNVTVGPGERWPDIVVAQTGFQGAAEVYWNRSMSYRGGHNGDQVGARHKGMYSSDGV